MRNAQQNLATLGPQCAFHCGSNATQCRTEKWQFHGRRKASEAIPVQPKYFGYKRAEQKHQSE
jgi:hypothetical protein